MQSVAVEPELSAKAKMFLALASLLHLSPCLHDPNRKESRVLHSFAVSQVLTQRIQWHFSSLKPFGVLRKRLLHSALQAASECQKKLGGHNDILYDPIGLSFLLIFFCVFQTEIEQQREIQL